MRVFQKFILALILISLIPLSIYSILSNVSLKQAIYENRTQTATTELETLDVRVNLILTDVQNDVLNMSKNPLLLYDSDEHFTNFLEADPETFEYHTTPEEQRIIDFFSDYRDTHANVNSIYYGTINGAFVRSHHRASPTKYDPRQRIWYETAISNPGILMQTPPYAALTTDDINIGTVITVADETGRIYGVLGMDITLYRFSVISEKSRHTSNAYNVILSEDDIILAHPDQAMLFENIAKLDFYPQLPALEDSSYILYENDLGEAMVIFPYHSDVTNWTYYRIVPVSEIEAPLRRQNLLLYSVFIILTLLSFFFSLIFSRFMSKRIQLISKAIKPLKKGDFSYKIPVSGKDELSDISRQFNDMVEQLDHYNHQIRYIDSVTSLLNRNKLVELLEQKASEEYTLITVHIANLFLLNTIYGYELGKDLIEIAAKRLLFFTTSDQILFRSSSANFTFLIDRKISGQEINQLARQFQQKMNQKIAIHQFEIYFNTQIGVLMHDESSPDPNEQLIDLALTSLSHNTTSGQPCAFFNPKQRDQILKELTIEKEIQSSLEKHEFYSVYQPIMDIASSKISGFEALARWRHPIMGDLYPDQFIPIMEKNRTIIQLGEQVIRDAILFGLEYKDMHGQDIYLSVNISIVQIEQPNFVYTLEKLLQAYDYNPKYLILEITETLYYDSEGRIKKTLMDLIALGLRLSLDDFGAGYSSINNLMAFPFHYLKVDKSLLWQSMENLKAENMMELIMKYAKRSDIQVVVEGIEDQLMLSKIQELEAEYGQGYYFSKPMNPDYFLYSNESLIL